MPGNLFGNLQKMYLDTTSWAKEQKQKAQDAEAEAERLRAEVEQRQGTIQQAETHQNSGFDSERYYQLLNEDPLAAQNYMDQIRFGVQDPVGAFNQMRQSADSAQFVAHTQLGYQASQTFLARHDDFPDAPRAIEALQARVVGLIRNEQYGADISDTIDMAYSQLVAEGVIRPVRDETLAPNPSLTGSGARTGFGSVDPDSMSTGDLEKLLRSRGMIR